MGVIPAVLLLLALSVFSTPDEPNNDSTLDQTNEIIEYEMNETFTFDAFEYTFKDAYYIEADEIVNTYTPVFFEEPDNVFVIEFEYTNASVYPSSPRQSIRSYDVNSSVEEYELAHHLPMVNPGRSGYGQLVYTVPDDVDFLEIEIGTDLYVRSNNAIVHIVVEE